MAMTIDLTPKLNASIGVKRNVSTRHGVYVTHSLLILTIILRPSLPHRLYVPQWSQTTWRVAVNVVCVLKHHRIINLTLIT